MKQRFTYTFLLLFSMAAYIVFCSCGFNSSGKSKVKIPRLSPKYNYKDKEPMGTYAAYHYINNLFNNGITHITSGPFKEVFYELNQVKSLYISVSRDIFLSKPDVEYMLRYVNNGNTVFLSAEYIDQKLTDTLGVDMQTGFSDFFGFNEYDLEKKNTWVTLADSAIGGSKKYAFYYLPFESIFSGFDSSTSRRLGNSDSAQTNFMVVKYGKGKFIFHSSPAAFSNYFLLHPGNEEYIEKVFSYFNPELQNIVWDNYYRLRKGTGNFSIFSFLKKYPSLNKALLLTLSLLLLFLAFGSKRKQRFVPEKFPATNTTVSYTETIGRLYLQKKDNHNIAHKMITYFLDYVRNHYYLNTQQLNNDFAAALARKSGVQETRAVNLLKQIEDVNINDTISDIKLLDLHNSIQEFIKK